MFSFVLIFLRVTNTEIWPYVHEIRAHKGSRPVTAATKPKTVLLTITSYMTINMNKDKHSTKFWSQKMPASLQTIHDETSLIFTDFLLLVFSMCFTDFVHVSSFFPFKITWRLVIRWIVCRDTGVFWLQNLVESLSLFMSTVWSCVSITYFN